MEEQELLKISKDHPVANLVLAFFLIAIASHNAWQFAAAGSLLYALALGLAPPLLGLLEWFRLRRRGPEARLAADRLIWIVLLASAGITL